MSTIKNGKRVALAVAATGGALLVAACGGSSAGEGDSATLSFANSQPESHPHNRCGTEVVQETLSDPEIGMDIDVFPDSQLGPHAERFTSVASGDIDIDLLGASEISTTFPEIGPLDAAYAFDGPDEMFDFADNTAFNDMADRMLDETGVRVLDVWYFGMRHFTANKPIRTPDDFDGLRMRFPDTPQFLMNAEAIGADPTAVAFEEVYLSLQQGTIDGQENPIPTIKDLNLPEVQSHVSLTGHQVGYVLVLVSEDTWQGLSGDHQEALQTAVSDTRSGHRECIEAEERDIVAEWQDSGEMTVIDDVDTATLSEQSENFFEAEYEGDQLAFYQAIRQSAG